MPIAYCLSLISFRSPFFISKKMGCTMFVIVMWVCYANHIIPFPFIAPFVDYAFHEK